MNRSKRRLILVWVAVTLLALRELLGLPAAIERIETDASERLRALSQATTHAISTTFQVSDRMLHATSAALPSLSIHPGGYDRVRLQRMLERHQHLAPGVSVLVLADTNGRIVAASSPVPPGISIADHAFFRLLKTSPLRDAEMGLVISQAMTSRITHTLSIQVARRIETADGRFAGVVMATIGVEEHFARIARLLAPSPRINMALLDENNRIMMQLPQGDEFVGKHLPPLQARQTREPDKADVALDYLGLDGRQRVGMLQKLDGFPLQVGVSEPQEDLFAPLKPLKYKSILFILSLLTAGGALSVLIWRVGKRENFERLNQSVFDHAREGIMVTDPQSRIIEANPCLCQMTGYTRDELLGQTPSLFRSGRHDQEFYRRMWEALQHTGEWRGEIWNRRKGGELYAQSASISAVRDSQGRLTHYIALMADITALKSHAEWLEETAHQDPLTQLPNRTLFLDRLHHALARAHRDKTQLAVCYIDLDEFKPVNDTYGHAAGDRLLIEIAARLRGQIRGGDTAARLGGDEFVLILTHLVEAEECRQAMERVLAAITAPVQIDKHTVSISASIGIALYPRDGDKADDLLLLADQAMYEAKRTGRNRYSEYT
jgi:diguanylate cyclase (GGDEF)-like protein/PAS domain S-box-containing protein